MIPYFLGIPVALVATGVFARFLARGGAINWLLAALLLSFAFLVHLTTAMVLAPAAAMAYIARSIRHGNLINWSILIVLIAALFLDNIGMPAMQRVGVAVAAAALVAVVAQIKRQSDRKRATSRGPARIANPVARSWRLHPVGHVAVWAIPFVVLALNAFWFLPGFWLAATKGASDFAFAHPEGVLHRLVQIGSTEAPVESVLIAVGLPGLFLLLRRDPTFGWGCAGFAAAGFGWGYLAGALPVTRLLAARPAYVRILHGHGRLGRSRSGRAPQSPPREQAQA